MALLTNGTNQTAVATLTTVINPADAYTYSFTFQTGSSVTGAVRRLGAVQTASGIPYGNSFEIDTSGALRPVYYNFGSESSGTTLGTLTINTKYRVVVTKAAGATGAVKFYCNSLGNTYSAATPNQGANILTRVSIGARISSSTGSYFQGKYARIAYWDQVLSDADITLCLSPSNTPVDCSVAPDHYWIAVANGTATNGGVNLTLNNGITFDADTLVSAYVDDINGSSSNPAIDVSSSNTANTTGFGTITTLTISDGTRSLAAIPSMPSGDGTFTFTWPYADGVIAPLFGSVTATFGDGTNSAAMVGNTPVPTGYASVTFAGATDISEYYLGHVLTLPDSSRMYYPTTNGAVIGADGSLEFATLPYTLNAMLHNVNSGGDGTITSVTVTITESGAVIVDGGGLTTRGLTVSGPTVRGLTVTWL